MEAGYKIEPDLARRFVRLTLFGFWDEATLERYKADVRALIAAEARLPTQDGGFRVLLDMRQHTLLSKEHAINLQAEIGEPAPGQRTAILVAHAGLLQRQAARVASALEPRVFVDEDEAMDWLFGVTAKS